MASVFLTFFTIRKNNQHMILIIDGISIKNNDCNNLFYR